MAERKIAVIGAGGKITTAVMLELAVSDRETPILFAMNGRNAEKMARTRAIVGAHAGDNIRMAEMSLDEALDGAEMILYCASYGYAPCGKWKSMGVYNGAHLMDIGERMVKLCPDAWLLVVTNPPDVPLGAMAKTFGLRRLIGLCNASVFTRKVLSSWLGCEEKAVHLFDIGINHELWYADVQKDGVSIYDELRKTLPAYDKSQVQGVFHDKFPEWRTGFGNNVQMMELTGWLNAPVGGSVRYGGTCVPKAEMSALMKRPTAADYEKLTADMTLEELYATTRRCAAEFPIYIADVLRSLLYNDGKSHSIQVLNGDDFPQFAPELMLQRSVSLTADGWKSDAVEVPVFIQAAVAGRAGQELLMYDALASQNAQTLRQAALVFAERMPVDKLDAWTADILDGKRSVEPEIVLN
ncbi:MAG: hypothetical protein E7463_04645 [Ruminococcaceae bacterium]|nr:hypothetical protein [Oscillospiraceae bacterium]